MTKRYAKKFPDSPKNVAEIIEYFAHDSVKTTSGQTLRGPDEETSEFFKHGFACKDYSFCLFASDDIIKIIGTIPPNERLFFCDGTFKVVPIGEFTQLLVLSVNIEGQVS